MDTFMDKLAQKLTAQEMIKANMAADAEEMDRLKKQVSEYRECFELLQKMIEDGVTKFENAKVDGSEINRLVEEGIAKFENVKIDGSEINRLVDEGIAKLDAAKVDGSEISRQIEESIAKINESQNNTEVIELLEELKKQIDEKLATNGENVHKECVKVYRNVQAVVQEESDKLVDQVSGKLRRVRKRVNVVMGITIASLVFSVAGIVLQILQMLNFKFF